MKSRKPPPKATTPKVAKGDLAFYEFLFGSPARNIAVFAAAVAALLYLNGNVFRPIYESGPPPFPARAEVDKLRDDTTKALSSIKQGFDEQAAFTKQMNARLDQQNAETRASRLNRLIGQRVTLNSLVEMNQTDQTLKQLLEQTNADIIRLQAEIARESSAQQAPVPK